MPVDDLLTCYSQRQTGIAPEGFGPIQAFTFGGVPHSVATSDVPRARAGARGRIEAIQWARPEAMPTDTDPVARVAVATMLTRLHAARVNATVVAVATTVPQTA